jgi:hypothetical protein
MYSTGSPPPEPTNLWPAENWLRRVAVVAGVITFWDLRGPILPFLGYGLLVALAGGHFARDSAERRRRWTQWKFAHPPEEVRRRWTWRIGWVAAFIGFSTWLTPELVVFLTAWWSLGWMAGTYVDRQTPEGRAEWAEWETATREWISGARQRQFEAEWSWAAAFETYELYRVARTGRPGNPIDDLDFASARRREKPPSRFGAAASNPS